VLAVGLNVRGFKPGRGDGFLRVIKIHSTPSFGGKAKPETPCCKISWQAKKKKYEQKYFTRPNSSFPSTVPPARYQMTAGTIAREL
jgi:hypothetical protein